MDIALTIFHQEMIACESIKVLIMKKNKCTIILFVLLGLLAGVAAEGRADFSLKEGFMWGGMILIVIPLWSFLVYLFERTFAPGKGCKWLLYTGLVCAGIGGGQFIKITAVEGKLLVGCACVLPYWSASLSLLLSYTWRRGRATLETNQP